MPNLDELRDALSRLNGTVVALDQRRAPEFSAIVAELARGEDVSERRLASLCQAGDRSAASRSAPRVIPVAGGGGRGLAIVSMTGVALYEFEFQPYCFSTRLLAQTMSEMADDRTVGTIVLNINTPGGQVTGTPEAADTVYNAGKKKTVVGIIDPLCASAGYWIGSQCSKLIAVPSADVGSIGVFMLHVEASRLYEKAGITPTFIFAGENKVEANSFEPLAPKAKDFLQREVDDTYLQFISVVARGRGVSAVTVKADWGGGRVLSAKGALGLRMIDRIEPTPDQALQSVVRGAASTASHQAEAFSRRLKLEAMQ